MRYLKTSRGGRETKTSFGKQPTVVKLNDVKGSGDKAVVKQGKAGSKTCSGSLGCAPSQNDAWFPLPSHYVYCDSGGLAGLRRLCVHEDCAIHSP